MKRLIFLLTLGLYVMTSCVKGEEENEYLPGNIYVTAPAYSLPGLIYELSCEGVTGDIEDLEYYWQADEAVKIRLPNGANTDTVYGQRADITLPDSLGFFNIYANAEADGYVKKTTIHQIATVDTRYDGSITGRGKGNGSFEDKRDGKNYYYATIGSLDWMVQNLSYSGEDKVGRPFQNQELLSDLFGRLYTWEEATGGITSSGLGQGPQGICPEGWGIPTTEDWEDFGKELNNGTPIPYDDMWFGLGEKAMVDADYNGEPVWDETWGIKKENTLGWNGIPAGYAEIIDNRYENLQAYGMWWNATEFSESKASYRYIYQGNTFFAPQTIEKDKFSISVRCVRLSSDENN